MSLPVHNKQDVDAEQYLVIFCVPQDFAAVKEQPVGVHSESSNHIKSPAQASPVPHDDVVTFINVPIGIKTDLAVVQAEVYLLDFL